MRWKSLIVSALLAGCASSSQSVVPQEGGKIAPLVRDSELGSFFDLNVVAAGNIVTNAVDAPPAQVWQVLRPVFASLKLPVTGVEEKMMAIGSMGVRVRGQLGDTRLSRLVDCGGGGVSAPNADRYTVFLSVASQASAGSGGATNVRTQVSGMAQAEGAGSTAVRCTSSGVLERMLLAKIHEHLLAAQKC